MINWACSEVNALLRALTHTYLIKQLHADQTIKIGQYQGLCVRPPVEDRITVFDVDFHQAVLNALKEMSEEQPEEPKAQTIDCPSPLSNASRKSFLDKTSKGFCKEVMKDLEVEHGPIAYNMNGNRIQTLKLSKLKREEAKRSLVLKERTPPGDRMKFDASIDVGCGKFTWHVKKPTEPLPTPSLVKRNCHDKYSYGDVHDAQQDNWSSSGCT